jgi:hypothetical protein
MGLGFSSPRKSEAERNFDRSCEVAWKKLQRRVNKAVRMGRTQTRKAYVVSFEMRDRLRTRLEDHGYIISTTIPYGKGGVAWIISWSPKPNTPQEIFSK